MKTVLSQIENRSEQLSNSPFCKWILKENTLSHEEIFSFSPSMLYFILGFRDILSHLEFEKPETDLEKIINQHCLEDRNHWKWYLHDLKTLGVNEASWGTDWSQFVENLWHDENKPTRDLVYLCIHLIKKYNSPTASLVIIECLESTFGVFMTTLKKRFESSSIYHRLQFFGQVHEEQEANHSMGHWIESDSSVGMPHSNSQVLENLKITTAEEKEFFQVINTIYDQFELVFQSWLELKRNYVKPQNLNLNNNNNNNRSVEIQF